MKSVFTAEEAFKRSANWTDFSRKQAFSTLKRVCLEGGWGGHGPGRAHWALISSWSPSKEACLAGASSVLKKHLELLDLFSESTNSNERFFADWVLGWSPYSTEYCFEQLEQSVFSIYYNYKPGGQSEAGAGRAREYFSHRLKLLLSTGQFRVVNFLMAHIIENADKFKGFHSERSHPGNQIAEVVTENSFPDLQYLPNLYASILDILSIRPLLSFINNYDMLAENIRRVLNPSLYSTLEKRMHLNANDDRNLIHARRSLLKEVFPNSELFERLK